LDNNLSDLILFHLPPSFSYICSALSNTTAFPKLATLISAIKAYEMQEKLSKSVVQSIKKEEDDGDQPMTEQDVMTVREGQKGVKGECDWGNSKEKDGVCHHCGRSGLAARGCVTNMPDSVKAKFLMKAASAAYEPDLVFSLP
jgi:hypothetical protein